LLLMGSTSVMMVGLLVLVLVCATVGTCVERCREAYSGIRLDDDEEGTYYSC
jgi:hypothetical protein